MYTILIVDDAKDSLLLLEFDLQTTGYNVVVAQSGQQALDLLETENIDMVLLDIYMPEMSGLVTLKKIKTYPNNKNIPVIMLSSSDNENEIVQALELGAVDYVIKPYINKVLLARINTAFRLAEKTAALELMAKKDYLTGINNRRNFYTLATKVISYAQRHQHGVVIAMCDIDHFKRVNDLYGHDAGDHVLQEVSKILANAFRDVDIIGRIGGEEFAVCLPETTIEEAQIACERVRVNVEHSDFITPNSNQHIAITISIGITLDEKNLSLSELLTQADQALYQAKNTGRNKIVVFSQEHLLKQSQSPHQNYEVSSSQEMPTVSPHIDDNVLTNDEKIFFTEKKSNDYPGINTSTGINNVLGDNDLFEQVLQMFIEDHAQDGENLAKAFADNDIARMKHLAHTLKGVSSSIGAMLLYKVTKVLDEAINDQNFTEVELLIPPVTEKLNEVTEGIKAKLKL
jgi:diguanylate cyclase (GGDEF)-like protein